MRQILQLLWVLSLCLTNTGCASLAVGLGVQLEPEPEETYTEIIYITNAQISNAQNSNSNRDPSSALPSLVPDTVIKEMKKPYEVSNLSKQAQPEQPQPEQAQPEQPQPEQPQPEQAQPEQPQPMQPKSKAMQQAELKPQPVPLVSKEEKVRQAIISRDIILGMSRGEVIESWGKASIRQTFIPEIATTEKQRQPASVSVGHELWIYGNPYSRQIKREIIFHYGYVTGWR